MASDRKFGIVTSVSGFTGIKVNSISRTYNTEAAEARDEKTWTLRFKRRIL